MIKSLSRHISRSIAKDLLSGDYSFFYYSDRGNICHCQRQDFTDVIRRPVYVAHMRERDDHYPNLPEMPLNVLKRWPEYQRSLWHVADAHGHDPWTRWNKMLMEYYIERLS